MNAEPTDPRRIGLSVARLSEWIDASYPSDMIAELVLRRRVGKLMNESGEVAQAMEGYTGENPRKGVFDTREHVMEELLDVAVTALGAWEHMDGNRGRSGDELASKLKLILARVDLSVPVSPATTTNTEHAALIAELNDWTTQLRDYAADDVDEQQITAWEDAAALLGRAVDALARSVADLAAAQAAEDRQGVLTRNWQEDAEDYRRERDEALARIAAAVELIDDGPLPVPILPVRAALTGETP